MKISSHTIYLSLELFGIVPTPKIASQVDDDRQRQVLKQGLYITTEALPLASVIVDYYTDSTLDHNQLNSTFYKSFQTVVSKSDKERLLDQCLHYLTTYGTNFESEYVYIPTDKLSFPSVKAEKMQLRVVTAQKVSVIIERCLKLLYADVALKETTIDSILALLDGLHFKFQPPHLSLIKNKEALVTIITKTGLYPSQPKEFLRLLCFLATGKALVINNTFTSKEIITANISVATHIESYGIKKAASTFYRHKTLWLAFKKSHTDNINIVNRMRKLAPYCHRPQNKNVLANLTTTAYKKAVVKKALSESTAYKKASALQAVLLKVNKVNDYLYRVRNGKSYAKEHSVVVNQTMHNRFQKYAKWIKKSLVKQLRTKVEGKVVAYPSHIDYALPTSEKNYLGNYPAGTIIQAKQHLAVGVYWENNWGANDLDLSYIGRTKIGWNSQWHNECIVYSGDMTNANYGASEVLRINKQLIEPALLILNIYTAHSKNCKFRLSIGTPPAIKRNYTMAANEIIIQGDSQMYSRQQVLGFMMPPQESSNVTSFVLINTGLGNLQVSNVDEPHIKTAIKALYQSCQHQVRWRELLLLAGATLTDNANEADVDLLPTALQKDTLLQLLT